MVDHEDLREEKMNLCHLFERHAASTHITPPQSTFDFKLLLLQSCVLSLPLTPLDESSQAPRSSGLDKTQRLRG